MTSVIGLLLGPGGLRHALFAYLSRVLPGSAFNLVDSTMYEISAASGGGKSLLVFLPRFGRLNGMGAITEALNAAYNVKDLGPGGNNDDGNRLDARSFYSDYFGTSAHALWRENCKSITAELWFR